MDRAMLEQVLEEAAKIVQGGVIGNAYARGNLSKILHSGQKKIQKTLDSSKHQLQVVLCARGFGKTYWGASLAVGQALKKPKSKIKIGTEFQTDLEALILPNFEGVLEQCPEEIKPIWKASKSKFVFQNGSEIALVGLDRKPNGLRGQHGVDLIILEEAGFISKLEALYRSVIVPTTTHRPECKIVLISTPPESLDHYFWTFVDRAELDESLSVFTIDENPMLTPTDIRRIENEMGGRDSTQFQREYLCKRVAEQSRMIIPEFDDKFIEQTERTEFFQFWLKSSALDSGVRDLTTALWAYYDFHKARLIVEDELVLGGKEVLTKNIFNRTRDIESHLNYSKVRRHADNNNLILIQDLNSMANQERVISGNVDPLIHWSPTAKDSIEASINLVRTWFNADRIRIHPRCKHTIGTLRTALWNKQRTDFSRSEVYGHADAIMSLVYLIRNVDVHTNPVPQTYGLNMNESLLLRKREDSQTAHELKNAFKTRRS